MENKPSRRDNIIIYSVSTILFLLIAFEIVALALWVPGTWNQKMTAVFTVVGMYGLTTAFFSRSGVLKKRRYVLEYLTSPHIVKYITGNVIVSLRFIRGRSTLPRFHKVRVTVHSVTKGSCGRGFKVGDSWLIESGDTPQGMCGDAFTSIYPAVRTLWLGGEQPWDKDKDVTYRCCPDADVMVVYEVRRLPQSRRGFRRKMKMQPSLERALRHKEILGA